MDRAAGGERGSHPSLGWGLPPYTGDHGRVKVIVAGAGIGGLTAALSLHAAGIDVLVIDAAVDTAAARGRHQPDAARGAGADRARPG